MIYLFLDGNIADNLRHISFQDSVVIGTVETGYPLTFTITYSVVIAKDAKVHLADNTTFKFNYDKKLIVNGYLSIGSVYFDTTNANALSHIVEKDSGKIYLGGQGKTINGLYEVVIDSGGYGEAPCGSTVNMMRGGVIYVDGTLKINSSLWNEFSRIVCRPERTSFRS